MVGEASAVVDDDRSGSDATQYIRATTPAGDGVLIIKKLKGEEMISGLFTFTATLVSEDLDLDLSTMVGKNMTVTIDLSDGSQRYIHGLVRRFRLVKIGDDDQALYEAEMVPWLWQLKLARDCRIFQAKTVPEIIKAVFTDLGFADVKDALTRTYTARDYCVWYKESAFDFVSRLMEDEGIFYYFEHAVDKHTLVLCDDADGYQDCLAVAAVEYREPEGTKMEEDVISHCLLERQVVPGGYTLDDYNFQTPATSLVAAQAGTFGTMKLYDFPGGFITKDAGDALAKLRLDAVETDVLVMTGTSRCRGFLPGHKFTMSDHDRADMNTGYVLYAVRVEADLDGYENSFTALPATVTYRPPLRTPRPRAVGAETATVVGKSGEEIWTDEFGRIKVQFHWDRLGQNDENSSCWVRVAQGWAGKSWGFVFLPRIGMEVIVNFLDGDPDRPIVTGAVYNGTQTVPYGLPDQATKSTIKSNTSKGGNGSNEIRFEDKKDAEEIYVHAQKDVNVVIENARTTTINKADETLTIAKGNRTETISEGNDSLTIAKGNRTVAIDTGNDTLTVKGTRDATITGDETHTNKADFTQEVTGNFTLKVSGNLEINVSGSVTINSGTSLLAKAGTTLTNQSGTDLTNKAGTNLTNQAGVQMTNKASASQTVDGGGMLTLKGGMVTIN
ncbi:MAG: type VI secretion system tip protein VgrG [Alphaproteobacteria bacterium]|nr:type VI secretion system tip protein VgrG [Alphaproteobacteria bacterium]